jgi:protein subunit release factor A
MDNQGHSIDKCPLRKKIEKNDDRSKDNKRKIEQLMSGDWYSNKDLYKMIQNLTSQLTEFNGKFDKYNGLIEDREKDRELLEKYISKVNKIETEKETKKKTTTNWREWIAWIVTILLALDKLGVLLNG